MKFIFLLVLIAAFNANARELRREETAFDDIARDTADTLSAINLMKESVEEETAFDDILSDTAAVASVEEKIHKDVSQPDLAPPGNSFAPPGTGSAAAPPGNGLAPPGTGSAAAPGLAPPGTGSTAAPGLAPPGTGSAAAPGHAPPGTGSAAAPGLAPPGTGSAAAPGLALPGTGSAAAPGLAPPGTGSAAAPGLAPPGTGSAAAPGLAPPGTGSAAAPGLAPPGTGSAATPPGNGFTAPQGTGLAPRDGLSQGNNVQQCFFTTKADNEKPEGEAVLDESASSAAQPPIMPPGRPVPPLRRHTVIQLLHLSVDGMGNVIFQKVNGDTLKAEGQIHKMALSDGYTSKTGKVLAYRPHFSSHRHSNLGVLFINLKELFSCKSSALPACGRFTNEKDGEARLEATNLGSLFGSDVLTYEIAFEGCSILNGNNGCLPKYSSMTIACFLPHSCQ